MRWVYDEADLERMTRVRAAFDPAARFNPGKVLPGHEVVVPRATAIRPAATATVGPDTWA
jgi:hypothetical protein